MGDVVGSIVSAAVEVLRQNLISLCKEEINLIRDFKKDLVKLKESFEMLQAFLNDAENKQVTDEAVKIWLKNLEAVAFDADNVLDKLNYEVLRDKVETGKEVQKWIRRIVLTPRMAREIREIHQRLELIIQKATNYGLQRQLRAHAPSVGSNIHSERETHSFSIDSIVVGRENYVSRIVEIFTSNSPTHDEQLVFSILPIVGMGGLGKTTLAKLVFKDGKIKNHFEKLIWVYVSKNFDAKDLFKKILESLIPGENVHLYLTEEALLKKIQQNLGAQKYFLVLDDVWIEESKKWDDFIETLSSISSVKGNGIIVTARSENVSSIVRTVSFPKLRELPDEDCWSIIKEKAFRKGCIVPSEFEIIGKKIAQRCHGLPLAATIVGGLLRGKSKEEWISIEETKLSNLGKDGDSIMKILKLSFDNLSSQSLKKCFAFCSIYPKGSEIEKEKLIYLWMAEGFLQSDQGNNMETVGEKYFNLLLQTSLLQSPTQDDKGNIVLCNMHDLVHDLACLIVHETGPIRYVYMKSDRDISKEEAGNLRSLVFEGKISADMFSNLKYLRGLVLIGFDNEELPTMEHLIHLRYLDISETCITCLPESVGNLYHLQTLQANNFLKKIPKVLKKLINLRHLQIFPSSGNSIFEEIPMLGHLPHLKSLYFGSIPKVRSIGSSLDGIHNNGIGKDTITVFPALERLQLSEMHLMTELLIASEIQLNREIVTFPRLEYLSLSCCPKLTCTPSYFPRLKELEISLTITSLLLENLLVNLTSLTTLTIFDITELVSLPDVFFIKNQNLSYLCISYCDNLTHLCSSLGASLRNVVIFSCKNLKKLPTNLHCLNSLERLEIRSCPNLVSIPFNPSSEGRESVQGFTSLRELMIIDCDSLTEVPSGMIELCTSLETLELFRLPSVTNMAAIIGCLGKMPHLTTLELDLRNIPKLANNNFATEMGCLRSLHNLTISGCNMENWDCVQDQLQHLTTLRYLMLLHMEIEEVPEWLGKLSCLRELAIWYCPKLRKLPSKEAMKWLTILRIVDCPLLNVRRDDDDSEWHKISHIAVVHVEMMMILNGTRYPILL